MWEGSQLVFQATTATKKQGSDGDLDGDSLASASNEEIEKSKTEELREEEELVDGFGNDFRQLFQSEEVH